MSRRCATLLAVAYGATLTGCPGPGVQDAADAVDAVDAFDGGDRADAPDAIDASETNDADAPADRPTAELDVYAPASCASPRAATAAPTFGGVGDTTNALDEQAGSCGGAGAPDEPWRLVLSAASDVSASVLALGGSRLRPMLAIRTACADASSEVACVAPGPLSAICAREIPSGEYFLIVDGDAAPAERGAYGITGRVTAVLAPSGPCSPCFVGDRVTPCDPASRCPDGTACYGLPGARVCAPPVAEVEPNDDAATAGGPFAETVLTGDFASAGDVDVFLVRLDAIRSVFVGALADPSVNGDCVDGCDSACNPRCASRVQLELTLASSGSLVATAFSPTPGFCAWMADSTDFVLAGLPADDYLLTVRSLAAGASGPYRIAILFKR